MDRIKHIVWGVFGIYRPLPIRTKGVVFSGKESYHNGGFLVQGNESVKIGSYCAIGKNVEIITNGHDYNYPAIQTTFYKKNFGASHPGKNLKTAIYTKGPVKIGNDVWIGNNVTILSGVTVGDGAVIGARSLVTKDVAPYSIVGGMPAKEIKKRFSNEVIELLLELKWWNWSPEKIAANEAFFSINLNELTRSEIEKKLV